MRKRIHIHEVRQRQGIRIIIRKRAKRILGELFHHRYFRFDRIAVNIPADSEEGLRGIDFFGEITALIDAADMAIALRVIITVPAVDLPHDMGQVVFRSDKQMKVVRHDAKGDKHKAVAFGCMTDTAHQVIHILFTRENVLAVIAAHDDMIIRIRPPIPLTFGQVLRLLPPANLSASASIRWLLRARPLKYPTILPNPRWSGRSGGV